MSELEIVHCLVVSLEVFVDGSPIKKEIWIWLLESLFTLGICFKSMLKFSGRLIVYKEVGQMSISKSVPTLRVAEILSNRLGGHFNTSFVIFLSLLSVKLVAIWRGLKLSVDH